MNRLFLTLEQAIDILPEGQEIHNFLNAPFGLIGADWPRERVIKALTAAETIEIGGEQCKALNHALVCIPKGVKRQSDIFFFESNKEKVEYYEKLLGGNKNENE